MHWPPEKNVLLDLTRDAVVHQEKPEVNEK